jgi:dienelactone hydrolase
MKQTIGEVDYYVRESDAKEGLAVRYAGKRGPVLLLIPGMGDRSQGALENLINVVDGYDYDGTGPQPRQYAVETEAMQAMAKKYGVTLITVTYPSEFNPNDVQYALNTVIQNYDVDPERTYIHGFSLGGGAVLRYITSSLVNASGLAGAAAAAPVNWASNIDNVVNAELQFIGSTYETDNTVPSSNVKNFVAAINARNPKYPAYLKVYPGVAHGGFNEMLANEAYWQWMAINSRAKRIPFTGGAVSIPTIPTIPTMPTTAKADFNIKEGQIITTSSIELDASASVGVINNNYYWEVTKNSAPWVGQKLAGGAGGGPKKLLSNLTDGPYTIRLTINGDVKSERRLVEVKLGATPEPEPTPKVPTVYSIASRLITFDDGSIEKAVSVTFKTESGKEYTL